MRMCFIKNIITVEQLQMNDCYYEKKDWRACKNEVSVEPQHAIFFPVFSPTPPFDKYSAASRSQNSATRLMISSLELQMEAFRQCWKRKGNEERTRSKDAAPDK